MMTYSFQQCLHSVKSNNSSDIALCVVFSALCVCFFSSLFLSLFVSVYASVMCGFFVLRVTVITNRIAVKQHLRPFQITKTLITF